VMVWLDTQLWYELYVSHNVVMVLVVREPFSRVRPSRFPPLRVSKNSGHWSLEGALLTEAANLVQGLARGGGGLNVQSLCHCQLQGSSVLTRNPILKCQNKNTDIPELSRFGVVFLQF
jgi:hypothetical protein